MAFKISIIVFIAVVLYHKVTAAFQFRRCVNATKEKGDCDNRINFSKQRWGQRRMMAICGSSRCWQ